MTFTPVYPDPSRVWLVDLSFYQDENSTPQGIDFNLLKEQGCSGVIIRAGQNLWDDPDFKVNWQAAKEAGLPRSAYWYLDVRVSANTQAKRFKDLLAQDPPEFIPFVDFEQGPVAVMEKDKRGKTVKVYKQLNVSHLNGFIETFAQPIGIYTGPAYWAANGSKDARYLKHPLWLAHYTTEDKIIIPRPWQNYLLWQWTAEGPGKQYGMESNAVDLNYFKGDAAAWADYVDIQDPLPNPIPSPSVPTVYIRKSGNVNVVIEEE